MRKYRLFNSLRLSQHPLIVFDILTLRNPSEVLKIYLGTCEEISQEHLHIRNILQKGLYL